LYKETNKQLDLLKQTLKHIFADLATEPRKQFALLMGVDPDLPFEICEMRRSMRVGPDGQHKPQIIIAVTQSRPMKVDGADYTFRGGATLIVDLTSGKVQYTIGKRINSKATINGQTREERTAAFLNQTSQDPLQRLLLMPQKEPFAALHSLADVTS
jgi:hypothetical protein